MNVTPPTNGGIVPPWLLPAPIQIPEPIFRPSEQLCGITLPQVPVKTGNVSTGLSVAPKGMSVCQEGVFHD